MCLALLLSVAWLATAGVAQAQVHVVETWPSGEDVVLGPNQNFYLRVAYDTDQPIHIWAQAYFQGERVPVGSNPSGVYSGQGQALAWFFFMHPGDQVDEVRIRAGDGSARNTKVVAVWRGQVSAAENAANVGPSPAWVTDMRAQAKAARDQAFRERMNQPVDSGDVALFTGFMLVMLLLGLAGLALPAWGLWRWRGGWRVAAAVPAAMMAFVLLRIIVGTSMDPTSHNLWPFEVLQAAVLSLAIMVILMIVRKFSLKGRR